jgi:hypothetical protein
MSNNFVQVPLYSTEKMLWWTTLCTSWEAEEIRGVPCPFPEFFYSRGRTDVLDLADGNLLIAFEAEGKSA